MTRPGRLVLFAYGFRPMFLGCGLFALVAVPVWYWVYATQPPLWMPVPAMLWHGHAMIFGFAGAAIAGFLLTAVWLAARVLLPLGPGPAWWIASSVEVAFLPLLAVLVAPPILRERNRNMVMLALLGALWCADALFLHAVGALEIELAERAQHAALDVILLLITLIGGRIVPAFTSNALRRGGAAVSPRTTPWIERSLVPLMALNVLVSAVAPTATATGALAIAAVFWSGAIAIFVGVYTPIPTRPRVDGKPGR